MTSPNKRFTHDELQKYITEKQEDLLRISTACYESKKITETFYNDVLSDICEADDFDEAFEYFLDKFHYLADQIQNYDYFVLLERIVKGVAYIEKLEEEGKPTESAERLLSEIANQARELRLQL